MNWAVAAKFAFGLSLAVLVFGSGLDARFSDVVALLRRPGLLARSLIAVLVVAPVLAVVLVRVFNLDHQVAIALVALSISPLPPLLPGRGEKAGGRAEYGLGLVLILAVLAVPMIAVSTLVLEVLFGRDYVVAPWTIGRLLILSMLVPLVGGMTVARFAPSTAVRADREGPTVAVAHRHDRPADFSCTSDGFAHRKCHAGRCRHLRGGYLRRRPPAGRTGSPRRDRAGLGG